MTTVADPRSRFSKLRATLGLAGGAPATVLALLLVVDLLLIAAHLATKALGVTEYLLDLGVDRGYAEFLQYVKTLWSMILLAALASRRSAGVYAAWALVCAYLGLDDALSLHEQVGTAFAAAAPSLGAAAVHVGELLWIAGIGLVLSVLVLLAHRRAGTEDRAVSMILLGLFGVLVVIGVGVDAVHHLLFEDPAFDVVWTAIEDGGEILVMSVIVSFIFAVWTGHRPSRESSGR